MTTGNRVADGLDQHLADEARWEKKQERRNYLIDKIDGLERKKDYLQDQWDDLDCESQELQEELEKLENE